MAKDKSTDKSTGSIYPDLRMLHSKKLRKELARLGDLFPKYDHQINKIQDQKDYARHRMAAIEIELGSRKSRRDEPTERFTDPTKE